MSSIKEQILAAKDARLDPMDVPEWGCTVYLPVVTVEDMEGFKTADGPFATARMAAFVIRDADGRRVFTDDDVPALAKKSVMAVKRVVEAFNKLNGFDAEDPAKNSGTTPDSASS